ncbi:MAG: dihydrodipicolinate reductase [Gammaproteobacteria bacterium RBG_16_57_12]|nr:MAG: dihydrodipicolinate reductase [Gammaproteobacteria bacterium RBG_16_57_12]
MKVGLIGYGKAGQAVAEVLRNDPRLELCWVARRTASANPETVLTTDIPIIGLNSVSLDEWLDAHPVDALVDFSKPDALFLYGEEVRKRRLILVSAISAYGEEELEYARSLGVRTRVLCSPNITVGINFLILAAKLLRSIAPFADVEILEQHFREKPEVSGTARKIAESLAIDEEQITSLRLGGIVGHHEVIFGFPYQTVRLIHDSIKREAFGTGAAFALTQLATCVPGFYTFDDLLMQKVRNQFVAA